MGRRQRAAYVEDYGSSCSRGCTQGAGELHIYVIGRDGEIRTRDPLHPMQVRYQAAPRPEPEGGMLNIGAVRCKSSGRGQIRRERAS
jgi:hypothetical protein